jgi:hypothetical protein
MFQITCPYNPLTMPILLDKSDARRPATRVNFQLYRLHLTTISIIQKYGEWLHPVDGSPTLPK